MIYLIDDKKNRQRDYGWKKEKFRKYTNLILPIYSYHEINESLRNEIFQDGNTILFHESFFDKKENNIDINSLDIRKSLNDYVKSHQNFKVVYFSGSKNSRMFNKNIAHLPVSILYQNLEIYLNENSSDLRYLLFGKDFLIEKHLIEKLIAANNNIDEIINTNPESKNFIAQTLENEMELIFENADYNSFFIDEKYNNEITDEYLNHIVSDWFSNKEYDNIFIPISFGPTLSDFNGLRLAMHIRCTDTPNRLSNIFVYSFVDHSYLIDNLYFDILKTKNVRLIEYKKLAFKDAIETDLEKLFITELPNEIKKVKIEPPKNYEDNHSIANEWALYRWANAINVKDEEIDKILNKVNNQLYFKYLATIYPTETAHKIPENQLRIKYNGSHKVLYIDDEAEKGWYEIFAHILRDVNNIYIDDFGEDFKLLSQEEIISRSIEKIKDDEINLVILDFRLHPNDFNNNNIQEITGLKLLKEIKQLNPGIQVIMFSATNKVWNLQALQEAGADGFIVKESPENSINRNFIQQSILSFILSIHTALERSFLIDFYKTIDNILDNLITIDAEDDSDYHCFIEELNSQLLIIKESGKMINLKIATTLDVVFLNCYNFLERFKNHYINVDNYHFAMGIDQIDVNRYFVRKGHVYSDGKFIRKGSNDKPSWYQSMVNLFVDYFAICNIDNPVLMELNEIKDKRNDYIHSRKSKFYKNELLVILNIIKQITKHMKE